MNKAFLAAAVTLCVSTGAPAAWAIQNRAKAQIADGSTAGPALWNAQCFFYPPTPPEGTGWYWEGAEFPIYWSRICGTGPLGQDITLGYSDDVPPSFDDLAPVSIGAVTGDFYFGPPTPTTCDGSGCYAEVGMYARFGSVHGYVKLPDGTPMPGARVVAYRVDDIAPHRHYVTSRTTDDDGHYSFTGGDPVSQQNNWGLELRTIYTSGGSGQPGQLYVLAVTPPDGPIPTVAQLDAGRYLSDGVNLRSSYLDLQDFVLYEPGSSQGPDFRSSPEVEAQKEETPEPGQGGVCVPDPSVPRPINLATGNVYFDQTDAAVPGIRRTVSFRRSYNSRRALAGMGGAFGPGWSHSYEKTLTELSPVLMTIDPGNGAPLYFQDNDEDQTFEASIPAFERSSVEKTDSGYVRHFMDGGRENYDSQGRLISQHDRVGNQTQIQRNEAGLVTAIVAPGGRTLTLTYDESRIETLSGPDGLIATYSYGTGQRLVGVAYNGGGGYSFTPDASGQILSVADSGGRIVEQHTYVDGRGMTSALADGIESYTVTYATSGLSAIATRGDGRATTYSLTNAAGIRRVASIVGPCAGCGGGQETEAWTYDTLGRPTVARDGLQRSRTFDYDNAKHLILSRTNTASRTTSFTRDSFGRPLTRTAADNRTVTATYDVAGPTTITDPLNRTTTIAYNAAGLPESVTNARVKTSRFEYNTFGDLTAVVDPLNNRATFEYDALGRRKAVVDPLLRRTETTYNRRGAVTRVTYHDGTHVDFEYDPDGRRTAAIDSLSRRTTYLYDTQGRTVGVRDAAGKVTAYGYDVMSRLITITDARGQVTRFDYDNYDRVTGVRYPGGRTETMTYDAVGGLLTLTDRKGTITTYDYDNVDQLVRTTYSDGTPASTFGYDLVGRLLTAGNGTDTLTRTYDAAGQLSSEASQRNGTTVSYGYDPAGARDALSLDGVPWLGYIYDDASRLTRIDRGASSFGFTYDAASRRTSMSQPNGIDTTYGYDTLSRLQSVVAARGPVEVAKALYTYDSSSNRLSKQTIEDVETYGYDDVQRLTSVERTGPAPRQWRFGYDAVGNRTTFQTDQNVQTATHNIRNELVGVAGGGSLVVRGQTNEAASVSVNGAPARLLPANVFEATVSAQPGTNAIIIEARDARNNLRTSTYEAVITNANASFSYDNNGNLLSRQDGASTWNYEWNARNQLTRVTRDTVEVARFDYDPLGRRVGKVAGAVTTSWAYDGQDILRETVVGGTGAGTYRYVHGPGTDEPLARATMPSGALIYFHADGLGSITKMTDQSGAVVLSRQYDAWGNLESGASTPGYAFTGREWDPETGLYYYRARYYAPSIGRFINGDPIGIAGGINLYSYVGSSPVGNFDPMGTDIWSASQRFAWGVAGGAGGTIATSASISAATATGASLTAVVTGGAAAVVLVGLGAYQATIEAQRLILGIDPYSGMPLNAEQRIDTAAGLGGALVGGGLAGAGREITFGPKCPIPGLRRVAPFGNRTGNEYGEWPHYHRAVPDPANPGESLPGQGVKRHRPWEPKSTDKSFWDRF